MKEIELSQGKFALVDDEDHERLSQFNWHVLKSRNTFYAIRNIYKGNKRTTDQMHCFIFGDKHIDHIDGNGLNNQKSNLRLCSRSQNGMNRIININRSVSSKYKGVSWNKSTNSWQSNITINRKQKYLGVYKNETDAAIVYNKKALELFGEFAKLNEIKNT